MFWKKRKNENADNKPVKKKFNLRQVWMAPYVDGNLDADTGSAIVIALIENGIYISWNGVTQHAQIPFTHLDRVITKTEEEIRHDVTLGRLLLVGIFAFGLKKKHVSRKRFTVISGNDINGRPVHVVLELTTNWLAYGITKKINDARTKYIDAHPEEIQQASETAALNEPDISTPDPIEQIKKLKDLLDANIISEEEFEAKKVELLKRI